MSQETIETVLGRMLTDDHFRRKASLQLSVVCREAGYLLSDEEVRLIGLVELSRLSFVAATLHGNIKRYTADVESLTV
jgi:hypothetical protein